MLQKKSRISGFCVSALLPPLRQGNITVMPKDGSITGSQASRRHNRNEVLDRTLHLCYYQMPQPHSLSTHRVKSNSLANNTRHLHSQLNPCCFSGISL